VFNFFEYYYTAYIPKKNNNNKSLRNLPHQPHKNLMATTFFFILKSEKWTVHLFSAAFNNVYLRRYEREREKEDFKIFHTITMHCVVAL